MGMSTSPWDNLLFASKGEVTCDDVVCANWLTASLHQIGSTVLAPTAQAIYAALDIDNDLDRLGMFDMDNMDVDSICISNIIYLSAPFMWIFLGCDLTPVEVWSRLSGAIVDSGYTVDFQPIIDWI